MRLFVGVPVPPADALRQATADLVDGVGGAKPVPDGTWHVTLRFLGDTQPGPVEAALQEALEGVPAVPARGEGVGAFKDPRRARVCWAAVEAPRLRDVERRVQEATRDLGRPPEDRDFVPHVTLARLREPADVRPWVARHQDTPFFKDDLDRVVLYESRLGPQGPAYTRRLEVPLAASEAQT